MTNSYFFEQIDSDLGSNTIIRGLITELESYAMGEKRQIYVIDKPVGERKYQYSYKEAVVILIPKVKLLFVNFGENIDSFQEYTRDFIEDIGHISDKYKYKDFLGRPRNWENALIEKIEFKSFSDVISEIKNNKLDGMDARKSELLISLLTGSINDINRVDGDIPENSLEQIKKNIILFDGEQTRFIFKKQDKKRITIQGLAGTGKTELLLNKLKDIYLNEEDSKIFFTCLSQFHNCSF